MSEKTETELSNADKVRRVSQELNPTNLDLSGIDYVASTIKRKRRQTGVLRYPLESLTAVSYTHLTLPTTLVV